MYISNDYQEAVVKCLNAYTVPEDMAHNLKVFTVPFLTDREHKKGNKEIDRTVINLPALPFFFPLSYDIIEILGVDGVSFCFLFLHGNKIKQKLIEK